MGFLVKITSLFLASVVLFSTMTFTIDVHFCGEEMVSVSLLGDADTCETMQKEVMDFPLCLSTKKSCCSDEQLLIKAQDIIETVPVPSLNLLAEQQPFVFLYTYVNLYQSLAKKNIPPKEYPPPLIKRAIYKLYETYLI